MSKPLESLATLFDGWNGYHQSIVNAVNPLTREQLAWRPAANFNAVIEAFELSALFGHIILPPLATEYVRQQTGKLEPANFGLTRVLVVIHLSRTRKVFVQRQDA